MQANRQILSLQRVCLLLHCCLSYVRLLSHPCVGSCVWGIAFSQTPPSLAKRSQNPSASFANPISFWAMKLWHRLLQAQKMDPMLTAMRIHNSGNKRHSICIGEHTSGISRVVFLRWSLCQSRGIAASPRVLAASSGGQ